MSIPIPMRPVSSAASLGYLATFAVLAMGLASSIAAGEAVPPAGYQATDADRAQLEQAVAPARTGDLHASAEKLTALLTAHPQWTDALLLQGQVLTALGDASGARDSYQTVLDFDPHNRTALLGVGNMSEQLGDHARALKAAETELIAQTGDGEAAILRAAGLVGVGRKEEAVKYIAALMAQAKGAQQPSVLAAFLPLQLKAEDYAGAETTATALIDAQPTADAYAYRADARRGLKKFDDATADLAAGFKLTGGQATYPLMYVGSQVLQDRGSIGQAMTLLVDLLELVPNNVEVEKAIERAVVARMAQMKASTKGDDSYLVPQIDYKTRKAEIENWELAAAVGKDRIGPTFETIATALKNAQIPNYDVSAKARAIYPAYEAYLGCAHAHAVFTLDAPSDWPAELTARAELAAREFRVAAAILAVRFSRYTEDEMFTFMNIEGYLDWADLQQSLKDGKLEEPDQRIMTAYVTNDGKDDWAAVLGYLKPRYHDATFTDSGRLTGPNHVLADRILENPVRLRGALRRATSLVNEALTNGDPTAALAVADQMVKAVKDAPETWVAQAKVLTVQGHSPAAHEALDKALSKDPLCAAALIMKGADFEVLGKKDEAMLAYNKAARGQEAPGADDPPEVAQAIAARDKLEQDYNTADRRSVYATRADAAQTTKEWPDVFVTVARLTYGFEPSNVNVYEVLARAAEGMGRYAQAAAAHQRALDLDSGLASNVDVVRRLADDLASSGETRRAVAIYDKALTLNPENVYLYKRRGRAHLKLGNSEKAVEDFKTAIAKGDTDPDTQLVLAENLRDKDPVAAAEAYKAVLRNPGEPEILHNGTQRTVLAAKVGLYKLQVAAAAKGK